MKEADESKAERLSGSETGLIPSPFTALSLVVGVQASMVINMPLVM